MPELDWPVVWAESGGGPDSRLVFLHGSGACATVWDGVLARLPATIGWTVLDLPGHGRSGRLPSYATGVVAAAVAARIGPGEPVVLVGHSLGGLVALTLANPIFGLDVRAVLGFSIKVDWTEEELARRSASASRPARTWADRDEALARFARVSGLAEAADPIPPDRLAPGIRRVPDGYALAHDRAAALVPPLARERIADQVAHAAAPVVLACGDQDRMSTPASMGYLGEVEELKGAGHNAHLTHPDLVAGLILGVLARHVPGAPGPDARARR
ncbi:alpha/beta hydrolase [Actinomadura sp. NBRC 104412]|uniref:alpha/beta fold hydrolase n=1 Tax=Actinomadura sp. NBRC 104412 TaxID=3032203 RepID=UPI0024A1CAAE|nr:alpha/beta hydrolase [Actinomadura sp. NBRC 104412]GLZ02595.1 alpha/beta hydrolase [Actinomadura sp. NBRC 104412]